MAARQFRRRTLLFSLLLCLALAASTSLVAATPLISHDRTPGSTASNPPAWGPPRGPDYALTFTESGLPAGVSWSVQLSHPGEPWLWSFNNSTNSSVGFSLPNDTYAFGIQSVTTAGGIFVATPSMGNVTVNGTAVTVNIVFAELNEFNLAFNETGLPTGASWCADVYNESTGWLFNCSTNGTVGFSVPNGTYNFTIGNGTTGNGSAYAPSPGTGNVSVNGTNVTVDVAFAPISFYTVTFGESGLPSGTNWSVLLWNNSAGWPWNNTSEGAPSPLCGGITYWNGSSSSTIGFTVPNGTYNFSIENVTNGSALYVPIPAMGSVTVNGTNVTVNVVFGSVPLFTLTFNETGLPNGTWWFVNVYNNSTGWLFNSSTNASIGFAVPNGTYTFSVGTESFYPVWGAAAPLCNNSSGNGTVFGGPYVASPASGNVSVNGSDVLVGITFAAPSYQTVTFHETGLPNGTFWSVRLSSDTLGWIGNETPASTASPCWFGLTYWNGSTNSTVEFAVPAATYSFAIGNVTNGSGLYVSDPGNGTVVVNGTNVTVSVAFSLLPLYEVTFNETGLPNGTFWWVQLSNDSIGPVWGGSGNGTVSPLCLGLSYWNGSSNSTVGFAVPNGTYTFSVGALGTENGTYLPTPESGNVTVKGTDVTVGIAFAPLSFYTVTFNETGLPNGTFWWVALGSGISGGHGGGWPNSTVSPLCGGVTYWNGSTGSTVQFSVLNGTYAFLIGDANSSNGTYSPGPRTGNVTVNGADVTVTVIFTAGEAPLPSGEHIGLGAPRFDPPASLPWGAIAAAMLVGSVGLLVGAIGLAAVRRRSRSKPGSELPPQGATIGPADSVGSPEDAPK
ncbi:MAG: hypothetical protein ACLQD9_02705 [Thermoplasmata archaeon]